MYLYAEIKNQIEYKGYQLNSFNIAVASLAGGLFFLSVFVFFFPFHKTINKRKEI